MRLIDAEALIEKAYWHGEHPDVENLYAEGVEAVDVSDIDDAPTIEAEPVRYGRWIAREYDDGFGPYKMYHCSECDTREAKKEKYCRECGVRMFLGGTYGEEQ